MSEKYRTKNIEQGIANYEVSLINAQLVKKSHFTNRYSRWNSRILNKEVRMTNYDGATGGRILNIEQRMMTYEVSLINAQ